MFTFSYTIMRVENKRCGCMRIFFFFKKLNCLKYLILFSNKNQVLDTTLKQNQKINARMLLNIVYEFDKISQDRTVI